MGTCGEFGNLGFVATWGLARFCGTCPCRWGQGRGGPESGDLDTLSYPSRGRDFNLNLVHDVLDRSLSAMPNAQQRQKFPPLLPLNQTEWSGSEVAVAWAATLLGIEDITIVLTE